MGLSCPFIWTSAILAELKTPMHGVVANSNVITKHNHKKKNKK